MQNKFTRFIAYLFGKKSEVSDLDTKDLLLAKTVLDIHRKRTHSSFVFVPLFSVKQIHAIDRENAIQSTEKRLRVLLNSKEELLRQKRLSKELLARYLPSVSAIKVVRETQTSYIAYEGNGRLVALQKAFSPDEGISVEVEAYHFRNPKKILRRMNRVRKYNNLD